MPAPTEPCFLYRFYDQSDRLLYVGISNLPVSRWKGHKADKGWWPDVVRIEATRYSTRADAHAAEKAAIRREGPMHNLQRYGAPVGGERIPVPAGRPIVTYINVKFLGINPETGKERWLYPDTQVTAIPGETEKEALARYGGVDWVTSSHGTPLVCTDHPQFRAPLGYWREAWQRSLAEQASV